MFKLRKEKRENEYAYDVNQQILQKQIGELSDIVAEHQKRIEGLINLIEQMRTSVEGIEQ